VKLSVHFADHVGVEGKRSILSFLNALTGSTQSATIDADYDFVFAKPAKLAHARLSLSEYRNQGILSWTEKD
jgi:hypothetical protein